jgi:hypothetical protein
MAAVSRSILSLLAVLAIAAGPALAQSAGPPTTVPGLTVEAPPHGKATFQDRFVQSLNFVTSHGAPAHLGQLARWAVPICPIAVGLSPEMNALVAERVKRLSFAVGTPQARRPGRCKPNVEILFTDKPQELLDLVAKRRNDLLGFHYVSQLRAVSRIGQPIEARYLTQTVAGAGNNSLDAPGATGRASSLDVEFSHEPGGCAGSAFTECLSSQIVNVLVIADANALAGRNIRPVAEYIAMISLAQFKMAKGCDAAHTLLDMFNPGCAGHPAAETPAAVDIAYLKALYGGGGALKLWVQKTQAAERMARTQP